MTAPPMILSRAGFGSPKINLHKGTYCGSRVKNKTQNKLNHEAEKMGLNIRLSQDIA
jgi:hypothetical protein